MKFFNATLILILFISFDYDYSYSKGMGLFTPIEMGTSYDELDNGLGPKWNSDYKAFGIGFVLDTKVAENALLNYRLNAGFTLQHSIYTGKNPLVSGTFLTNGYNYWWWKLGIDNTLGFGFLRTSFMRLWAGPQLRIGFGYGLGTDNDNALFKMQVLVGAGPVFGANIHISDRISLCADIGYRFGYLYGFTGYDRVYIDKTGYINRDSNGGNSVSTTQGEVFINISLIFRINDYFGSELKEGRKSKHRN